MSREILEESVKAQYSNQLKNAVINFVKDERCSTDDSEYIPIEFALPKKDFPIECKNYKTDWVDENDFLVEFEDIIKIVDKEV
tara:strand:- start:311 stop:559 length:249 start_codon:yes stop_codon:yes gene_type:complete